MLLLPVSWWPWVNLGECSGVLLVVALTGWKLGAGSFKAKR